MNIAQLRDIITTLLGASPNLIGSYALPDGSTIPAVYVVGRQGVPAEFKVEGMEVAIREFAEPRPSSALSGTVKNNQLWEITLTEYTTGDKNVSLAMDRLMRRFPDLNFRYFPGADISYDRCRVLIPDLILRPLIPQ